MQGVKLSKKLSKCCKKVLPPYGNVRALIITEKQFDNIEILLGNPSFNENVNEDKNLVLFDFDENAGDYRYGTEYQKQEELNVTTTQPKQKIKNRQPSLFEF